MERSLRIYLCYTICHAGVVGAAVDWNSRMKIWPNFEISKLENSKTQANVWKLAN